MCRKAVPAPLLTRFFSILLYVVVTCFSALKRSVLFGR